MVMTHSDDKGLVLPPRVAPVQVVIIPIWFGEKKSFITVCTRIRDQLRALGVRVEFDDRETYTPGWKFNHWELKGVPLRLEVGPKDLEAKRVTAVRRNVERKKGNDTWINIEDIHWAIRPLLEDIQQSMFQRAKQNKDEHTVTCRTWDEFLTALDGRNVVLAPWCEVDSCEEAIKTKSGEAAKAAVEETKAEGEAAEASGEKLTGAAKSLCMPFNAPEIPKGCKCFHCGQPAKKWVLWGRSY
jgi:prolyl-tRNA synthetase